MGGRGWRASASSNPNTHAHNPHNPSPTVQILIKTPDNRRVTPADSFTVNGRFTDRVRRVRVPLPVVDDRRRVVEDVDKDRKHAIDAAVVRVMKSRKARKGLGGAGVAGVAGGSGTSHTLDAAHATAFPHVCSTRLPHAPPRSCPTSSWCLRSCPSSRARSAPTRARSRSAWRT